MAPGSARTVSPWLSRCALLAVGLGLAWFFPYQAHINNPNENVRVYLTRAIVEHGTVAIGRRTIVRGRQRDRGSAVGEWGWVNDKALVCDDPGERPPKCEGRLLAAKAPLLSLIAVPPYALLSWGHRSVTGEPPSKALTIRVLRMVTVTIPWVAFLLLFHVWLVRHRGIEPWAADLAALALALGSVATPYAQIFASHTPVAMTLGGALLLLDGARGRPLRTLAGGLLLAGSPGLEYPMAVPAAVLVLWAVVSAGSGRRLSTLGWLVLGAVPAIAGVLVYHALALGSPLATPYAHLENAAFVKDSAAGFHGVALPSLRSLGIGLLSPQVGLLFFSPAALLAPIGVIVLLRRKGSAAEAPDGATSSRSLGVALGVGMLALILLMGCMPTLRKMLGWTVGPRYITAIAPFWAAALAPAAVWLRRRWHGDGVALAWGITLVGVVLCTVPALLYPHYPMSYRNPSFQLGLPLLLEGYWPHSLGTRLGGDGATAALPGLSLLVAGGGAILLAHARPRLRRLWDVTLALLVAASILALLSLPGSGGPTRGEIRDSEWVRRRWVPPVTSSASATERQL